MAMSLNEIAKKSGDAVDQAASSIGNYPIDWGTVIFWIVVVVVGFWLLGKIIQFFEWLRLSRARRRQ
jgi:hypothetical protein